MTNNNKAISSHLKVGKRTTSRGNTLKNLNLNIPFGRLELLLGACTSGTSLAIITKDPKLLLLLLQ